MKTLLRINLALLASVSVLASVPAEAQGVKNQRRGEPIELVATPDTDERPLDMPRPASAGVEEEVEEDAPITMPADTSISVMPVTNISLDTLGVLEPKDGALPVDVWEKSEQPRILALLNALPDRVGSETVRDVLVRLLLSSARSPKSENIRQNVFAPRIDALFALGEAERAAAILGRVPADQRNETMLKQQFLAQAYAGNVGWICENIGDALAKHTNMFWQHGHLFCRARQGESETVQVAMDVLNEQQKPVSDAFRNMISFMLNETEEVTSKLESDPAPEEAIWFALAGVDVFPEGYLARAPRPIAERVAANTTFLDYVRDAASKRLQVLGANGVELSKEDRALATWVAQQVGPTAARSPHWQNLAKMLAYKSEHKNDPATLLRQQFRLAAVMRELNVHPAGATIDEISSSVMAEAGTVSPLLLMELDLAAKSGRKGEVILLAAIAAGAAPVGSMDDHMLAQIVSAFNAVGLEAEARALAAEAVVSVSPAAVSETDKAE